MVSPARRRDAVKYLCRRHKVSERRACQLIGQHRSTQRYASVPTDYETRLVAEMHALATEHPRFGYRMVHALLVDRGWAVNRKRIERLWRLEGLKVPPARKKRWGNDATGVDANSAWALPALAPGHVWSYDFVAARTRDGGPLRILNVVDEFTRECVGVRVARNIGTREVRRFLERLFAERGRPEFIRSDNGREFSSAELVAWLTEQNVTAAFIAKASPQQNCYIERFNGTMRDQLLNGEEFDSVLEAKVVIEAWVVIYNTIRPHRALKMRTPERFAADWRAANPNHWRQAGSARSSTAALRRGTVTPVTQRDRASERSR
jgi:transposase InsO family protein